MHEKLGQACFMKSLAFEPHTSRHQLQSTKCSTEWLQVPRSNSRQQCVALQLCARTRSSSIYNQKHAHLSAHPARAGSDATAGGGLVICPRAGAHASAHASAHACAGHARAGAGHARAGAGCARAGAGASASVGVHPRDDLLHL